jgi:dTDP-4-dehydrorhamnose 3,5-epimerase
MRIETTPIKDVLIIHPKKHGDHRGFFSETFKANVLAEHGVSHDWVQDNHSYSAAKGVVRGLHFQTAPFEQAKLLRVVRGAVLDVVVDIRRGSPTYGHHVAVELSAENWAQIYVPVGFAHGFCTLTEHAEVQYKVTAPFAAANEGGLTWNDPDLAINWPVTPIDATLSDRDRTWPAFKEFQSPFSV